MTLSRAAICVFCTLTLVPMTAEATISSVTVNTTRDYENAAGYTYAEITIHGSVARADGSVGLYAVPAVLIYPRPGRGNGVGVVDWLNSSFYHFFLPTTEFGTFQFTLSATGNYLFEEGYTYVSIQWDKAVTETLRAGRPARRPTAQPPGLRVHRPKRRCVGDPAGRSASAEGSERLSGQRRTCAESRRY